jgi:hypothetical protein
MFIQIHHCVHQSPAAVCFFNETVTSFYDRMTVHRKRFLAEKPTDALNSNFICITTLLVSGSLSAHHQEFLVVYRFWYILCSGDDRSLPGVG